MERLTKQRILIARDVLDKYTRELHNTRHINTTSLELELRKMWDMGYQTLKDVMIDMLSHSEYAHLAAYYMENSGLAGLESVVGEFQRPLAELYGLSSWYNDSRKDELRNAYWEKTFAVISQFDINENGEHSILHISTKINKQLIKSFLKNPKMLYEMQPRRFEELIAELFDGFGYKVELTKTTKDGGKDIIAISNNTVASNKYLIECKRYNEKTKVGVLPVRSLLGVVQDEKATKGLIVTTSSFSKPANELIQRHKWILEGHDYNGILEWLKEYQKLKFG